MSFTLLESMKNSRIKAISRLGKYLSYLYQYRSILRQMVDRDFKGRFKNTVLGYFWHLLNPLSQIIIYLLIFTVIFGRDVPNYWVYISTGMFAYTFFMASTSGISNCIVWSSGMVTKMAMAREIIVISKVITNLITLSISYTILVILMVVSGVGVTINILFIPLVVFIFAFFCLGLGFLLSAITVYLRDVANAANILFGCLMFAVPIFYLPNAIDNTLIEFLWSINPLYYFIEVIHDSFYWGVMPDMFQIFICVIASAISLILGLLIFKKLERGFAERL